MNQIWRGLKFGMLLQLAVGPMCLFVFNTAARHGLGAGMSVVFAIALVDALFIVLSGVGVGTVLRREGIRKAVQFFGAAVLVLFGANMIAGVWNISLLPDIRLFSQTGGKSLFWQGVFLTASNPLTILFWSGVFSTQVIENHYDKRQLCGFGAGCVLSTLFFLTLVALLGTALSAFLPDAVMRVMNAGVGLVLVFYGIKLLFKRGAA